MKKNVWILNHYATDVYFDEGGRHFWIGKDLVERGYHVTIFCANTVHKSDQQVDVVNGIYERKQKQGLDFVFIKTKPYMGNGISRVRNMLDYTRNMLRLYRKYAREFGKPDVIYASSVHPLALYAGVRVAKHYRIKAICEIRDMWPLTLIELGRLKENSLIAKLMFWYERKIYQKADNLIFTMEGGAKYIQDKGWDTAHGGKIQINKVHYINNGMDVEEFLLNRNEIRLSDVDLEDKDYFHVVYAGTLGRANRIDLILDIAQAIQEKKKPIRFLIWGDGDKREELEQLVKEKNIQNVVFKGKVSKKYIPYITSNSDLNISVLENCGLYRYGLSLNKMFDYMVAQRPFIIAGAVCNCELLEQNVFCKLCQTSSVEEISDVILQVYDQKQMHNEIPPYDKETLKTMCDFEKRTDELVKVIEGVV